MSDTNKPPSEPEGSGGEGDKRDQDEAPETPLDEPRPPRIEEPPPPPEDKGPYVVSSGG